MSTVVHELEHKKITKNYLVPTVPNFFQAVLLNTEFFFWPQLSAILQHDWSKCSTISLILLIFLLQTHKLLTLSSYKMQ
jgi:hypothetical protein